MVCIGHDELWNLWGKKNTCILEGLWKHNNDAMDIINMKTMFSFFKFCQNAGAPFTILLQWFALCGQPKNKYIWLQMKGQIFFCKIKPFHAT